MIGTWYRGRSGRRRPASGSSTTLTTAELSVLRGTIDRERTRSGSASQNGPGLPGSPRSCIGTYAEAVAATISHSFCGKLRSEVERLIAGPDDLYICDRCVDLCNKIIEEERART